MRYLAFVPGRLGIQLPLLTTSRSGYLQHFKCSQVKSPSFRMVVTRSAKRKPEETQTSTPKRQATSKARKTRQKDEAPKPQTASKAASSSISRDGVSHYLFKSEPESRMQNGHEMKFSIDDLAAEDDQITHWDGVRNAEARNTMKAMKKGDLGFFYHSNTRKSRPGIVGIVEVVKEAYPDHTAFDKNDPHFDAKSSEDAPRWFMVDVRFIEKFPRCITLDEVKASQDLSQMQLVKRGRISVQRVTTEEWGVVCNLAKEEGPGSKSK